MLSLKTWRQRGLGGPGKTPSPPFSGVLSALSLCVCGWFRTPGVSHTGNVQKSAVEKVEEVQQWLPGIERSLYGFCSQLHLSVIHNHTPSFQKAIVYMPVTGINVFLACKIKSLIQE